MIINSPQEIDYLEEEVILEYSNGRPPESLKAYLLRLYPKRFNGYDAYVDTQFNLEGIESVECIETVTASRLKKKWKVIEKPQESPIGGFPQNCAYNYALLIDRHWRFGLQEV